MLIEIKNFLDNNTPPVVRDIYYRAFNCAEALNHSDLYKPFDDLVMQSSDLGKDDITDMFGSMLLGLLTDLLLEHEVIIHNDCELITAVSICEVLLTLDEHADLAKVYEICLNDESPEEKLADIVGEILGIEMTEILKVIASVSVNLILEITKMADAEVRFSSLTDLHVEDNLRNHNMINQLKWLNSIHSLKDTKAFYFLESKAPLGLDSSVYFTDMSSKLDQMQPEEAALEIYSLLLISSNGFDNPIESYRKMANSLFSDFDTITKVESSIKKLIQEVSAIISQTTLPESTPSTTVNGNLTNQSERLLDEKKSVL